MMDVLHDKIWFIQVFILDEKSSNKNFKLWFVPTGFAYHDLDIVGEYLQPGNPVPGPKQRHEPEFKESTSAMMVWCWNQSKFTLILHLFCFEWVASRIFFWSGCFIVVSGTISLEDHAQQNYAAGKYFQFCHSVLSSAVTWVAFDHICTIDFSQLIFVFAKGFWSQLCTQVHKHETRCPCT